MVFYFPEWQPGGSKLIAMGRYDPPRSVFSRDATNGNDDPNPVYLLAIDFFLLTSSRFSCVMLKYAQ